MTIPLIPNNNQGIPNITVNGTGIPMIPIQGGGVHPVGIRQTLLADIRNVNVRDTRPWMVNPPQAVPVDVPVTVLAGTPIVNMPGCVTVHKENAKKDPSRNKMLVNDDPSQNVTLCDAGMPYYQPPDYDYRELSWQTVYMNDDQEPEGVDSEGETPDAPVPDSPTPPPAGGEYKDPDCPGPLDPRVGAVGPNEKEKVVGHELQPDPNNLNKNICVALYEDIGIVEQYLPSAQVATTTAVIASVAASSALLAKPLADLLLKVVKPVVKKVIAKVKGMLGQTPHRPNLSEQMTNRYREKKGMLPLNFGKKKKTLKKKD